MIFTLSILLNIYLLMALGAMGRTERMDRTVLRHGDDRQVVAVYRLQGGIYDEAAEGFARFHRNIIDDTDVKAVVLRVDSPGGAVSSSDQIHSMIRDLQTKGGKKVIVSMGGVAASGGYYISAPADEIFAERTTMTGSVGVIMAWMIIKGTLDKIGMAAIVLKSQDSAGWKDLVSPFQKPDDRQRAALQGLLDSVQKRFEEVVREGRGQRLKTRQVSYTVTVGEGEEARQVERTDTVPLNGQIFTPQEALEWGLIDAIGYEDNAINRAGELAGLTKPKVVVYEPHKGLLVRLMEGRVPAGVKIGPELLDELQSPRLLMLWKAD